MTIDVGWYILVKDGEIFNVNKIEKVFIEAQNDNTPIAFIDKVDIIDSYSSLTEMITKVSAFDYFSKHYPEYMI